MSGMHGHGPLARMAVGVVIPALLAGCAGASSPPASNTGAGVAAPVAAGPSLAAPATPAAGTLPPPQAPASAAPGASTTVELTGFSIRAFGLAFGPVTQAFFAVDGDGNVYLPGGTVGAALVKIGRDGRVLARWAGLDVVPGQPDTIAGITLDTAKDVWVTDMSADRVVRLTPGLSVLTTWGATGPGRGEFLGPGGIAIDRQSHVVVVDVGNDRLETFMPDGTLVGVTESPGGTTAPIDVAVDGDGNQYVSTLQSTTRPSPSGRIIRLDPRGDVSLSLGSSGGSGFFLPDAAVDNAGNIWVADAVLGLLEFDAAGTQTGQWPIAGGGRSAVAVRVAPSGHVYTLACGSGTWDCTLAELTPTGERVATWHAAAAVDHPGSVVAVDGHGLYLQCAGTGSPTIVWQAGYAGSGWIDTAQYLMGRIATISRVCVYDRLGQGFSEPNPDDDFLGWSQTVRDLHDLLAKAAIPGPYVMAGYSFGGLLARLYAYTYRNEVAGLVLVDPGHEDQFAGPPNPDNPIGITTCADPSCPVYADIEAVHALTRGTVAGSLGALPMVVLSHSPTLPFSPPDYDAYWEQLGAETATASSNSVHVVASWSSHQIPLVQPGLVIEAVDEVVAAARAPGHTLPACGAAFASLGGACR